jgi:hypothetical protein
MSQIGEDELFEMVNLVPRLTGLPMTIWVSPRGNARHGPRIKVNMAHGRSMSSSNLATVAVDVSPWLVAGHLSGSDLQVVGDWIRLNRVVLVDYWDFRIDTDELLQRLQPLSPPVPP